MEGLDHEGAHPGEGKGAVAVDAPDEAPGAEATVVGGVGGDGAFVGLGEGVEGAHPGGIHTATIRRSVIRSNALWTIGRSGGQSPRIRREPLAASTDGRSPASAPPG